MAKFAVAAPAGAKRIAILTDNKNDYSVGLTEFFRDTARKLGAEIVAEESYSEGDIEFKAQLTAIKADNPDVLFVPGYYTECALIARQARELGLDVAAARRRRLGQPEDGRDRRQGGGGRLHHQPLFAPTISAPR